MNRRLYFMLPDAGSAHAMMDEMLLARVNADHINFLARPETDLGDLPEATISERTDLFEGWELGTVLGGLLGLVAGLLAVSFPIWPTFDHTAPMVAVPICIVVGMVAGGLWTGLVATAIPDTHLKPFQAEIAQGKVLMIVRVPFHRAAEIRKLVANRHPEAVYDGTWPTDHAIFP